MNKEEIKQLLQNLASSQGFYQRILDNITEEDLDNLESRNFKDSVDLIMFLEG